MDIQFRTALKKSISDDEMRIMFDEPMKNHTTFRIGGCARCLIMPKSISEIKDILSVIKDNGLKFFIMGNGSNLLVSDEGIEGVVIKLDRCFSDISVNDNVIRAQSGALLSKIANTALDNSLCGFEFAAGIPGTLGGALKMNAGAYGGEMKDVVKNATLMDTDGNIFTMGSDELGFGYRHSNITDDMIVLEAEIELALGDKVNIKETMQELSFKRKDKQPLEFPSAGSTFKRPEGYFAAKLIEDAGLKGYSVGGAKVSEKHSGFVINTGDATCDDVLKLISHIKNTVMEKFGVELSEEVKIIR